MSTVPWKYLPNGTRRRECPECWRARYVPTGRPRGHTPIPEAIRFWAKVTKGPDCWEWTASHDRKGYGRFMRAGGSHEFAHRTSWELTQGQIPPGLFVCHHCDNPPCVRPDHLFLGTGGDNMTDSLLKGRHNKAKLTPAQVREIRERYTPYVIGYKRLAHEYGVDKAQIVRIIHGRQWRAVKT